MSTRDLRYCETDGIELRVEGEGETVERYVEGIGIIYDREVELWPGFFETIRAGAFEKSLDARTGGEIKSFFNHDASMVLATTRSKPALRLEDTPAGVRFRAPIPPTSYGDDLRINLERKNVRGSSFSFSVAKDGDKITIDEKGSYHREILKGTVYEVGPVTNPAYPQAKAGLRDAESTAREYIDAETEKRDAQKRRNVAALALLSMKTTTLEREGAV